MPEPFGASGEPQPANKNAAVAAAKIVLKLLLISLFFRFTHLWLPVSGYLPIF